MDYEWHTHGMLMDYQWDRNGIFMEYIIYGTIENQRCPIASSELLELWKFMALPFMIYSMF